MNSPAYHYKNISCSNSKKLIIKYTDIPLQKYEKLVLSIYNRVLSVSYVFMEQIRGATKLSVFSRLVLIKLTWIQESKKKAIIVFFDFCTDVKTIKYS